MKSNVIVFSVMTLCIFFSCKNEQPKSTETNSQEIKENYGTGETSRVYNRINGKIEGKMTDYYPSGALKGEKYFEDNKQTVKQPSIMKMANLKKFSIT
jgi:antitoxin component YwqK of YwqJK toxin-antitoxin module